MTDVWVDCTACGTRYGAFSPSCPSCGAANGYYAGGVQRSKSSSSKAVILIAVLAGVIGIILLTPVVPSLLDLEGQPPPISILPPLRQDPVAVPQEELIAAALEEINKDRASFDMPPVKLSLNQAAQVHAEDVFRNKQISHWMSNGEKPYMTYSRYGGEGGMGQNVAIAGFSREQYDECVRNALYDCEKIDPVPTIRELEYEMMYNDLECCADGHRNNILNEYRTDVSIGIAYDRYYLVLVQNFENNYGLDIDVEEQSVSISGETDVTIDHLAVYYDPIPAPSAYEDNKRSLSYSGGQLVAYVVKPLPPGFYYEKPDGYRLLVANQWAANTGGPVDISFNLARAVVADGVYTVAVIAETEQTNENFEAASYSVVIESGQEPES